MAKKGKSYIEKKKKQRLYSPSTSHLLSSKIKMKWWTLKGKVYKPFELVYAYWWLNIAKRAPLYSAMNKELCPDRWCISCGKGANIKNDK